MSVEEVDQDKLEHLLTIISNLESENEILLKMNKQKDIILQDQQKELLRIGNEMPEYEQNLKDLIQEGQDVEKIKRLHKNLIKICSYTCLKGIQAKDRSEAESMLDRLLTMNLKAINTEKAGDVLVMTDPREKESIAKTFSEKTIQDELPSSSTDDADKVATADKDIETTSTVTKKKSTLFANLFSRRYA
ncbi:hypothetical protein BC833DRAFT_619218 [Globomyces pollinis-pini]|nr:hypothetical protein BC833DRAFT_619218 [Globomyces pollinis-pini]